MDFTEEETQTADKHMQRCSMSLVIREVPIKTLMRYHYTLIRSSNIKNTGLTKSWQEHRAPETLIPTVGNMESYTQFASFLKH